MILIRRSLKFRLRLDRADLWYMSMGFNTLGRGLFCTAILCCLVCICAAETADSEFLGDESDGSRTVSVHLMPLVDEEGRGITPADKLPLPFSVRQSCGLCHDYNTVSHGWHFNAVEPDVAAGRIGQPWIFVDAGAATQVPLSYRPWPGTFHPEQLGITPWKFVQLFGRQMPGGGVGELVSDVPEEIDRQFVSGRLETNCLACHNADPAYDQSEYVVQIARQNLRWAATAACRFASVSGSAKDMPNNYDYLMPQPLNNPRLIPPAVTYKKDAFDEKNRVFFDLVTKIPAERCYFCHSNYDVGEGDPEEWAVDEDVHLYSDLACVSCHRNGLEHNIIRGYEGEEVASDNPLASASSCESCHNEGRLGATVPRHLGIPIGHFDKLACTACHSGRLPEQKTMRTKTSRAHGLGVYSVDKTDSVLPHIIYPVFAKRQDGKIAPHKLIWPAFFGVLKGGQVFPMKIDTVRPVVTRGREISTYGDWPALTGEQIAKALGLLQMTAEGEAVYICGGKLHRLDGKGGLIAEEYSEAKPYLWPIAHDVRPAAQSLGARRCEECHSTDSPFFFADVEVDSPIASEKGAVKSMIEFQQLNPVYMKLFAFSFVFRPFLKVAAICSAGILAAVLLLYVLKALGCIAKVTAGRD